MRTPPRLRTVLLAINLLILLLPLGGIVALRVYESALVRQTESELVAQGAFVASAYRRALERAVHPAALQHLGRPLLAAQPLSGTDVDRWRPRPAKLDLAVDPVLPPPAPAVPAGVRPDARAAAAGREITVLMRDAQAVTLAAIRVVDADGTVVATTGEELGRSLSAREEVARALAGEHVSVLRRRLTDNPDPALASVSRSTGVRVFVVTPIVHRDRVLGAVVLARTPASLAQTLYRHRAPLLFGLGVLVVAVIAVSLFTAVTIARPVAAIIRQTERAQRGEKGAVTPLAHAGTHEFAQLSGAVAALAQTLEERADYIRNFAAHVSHEFKTPLTAMQGAVELLREHGAGMSEEERSRFLDNLAVNTGRLDRLVRRLLDLARADTIRPGNEATPVGPVLARVCNRYRAEGLDVSCQGIRLDIYVAMAGETLESILANLLENARQHGGAGVQVQVTAESPTGGRGYIDIIVSDNGPGVTPANLGRVFDPFFTTARDRGGTGLGLAVVRSLVEAHGGSVELRPSARGAKFVLRLPAVGVSPD